MDIIARERLNERATEQGELLIGRLREFAETYDFIGDVRGVGAMVAMELVHERDSHRPDKELTQQLVQEAGRQGLILLTCGVRANVIRFLIPLTAEKEIVTEGLNILSSCLKVVQNTRPAK
ncbi:Gamma-aminobutyrate:alpha-ketoglutarate aminotransferase [Cronobacter dublinensis 582]|nr:Gamma-aminobutyrate:alpha-ketoglutarate aminotransferase [Cronobacter dublinensis 582]